MFLSQRNALPSGYEPKRIQTILQMTDKNLGRKHNLSIPVLKSSPVNATVNESFKTSNNRMLN